MHEMVGLRVMHRASKKRGRINDISNGKMYVSYADSVSTYAFPECLTDTFILEDEELQNKYKQESFEAKFLLF